MCSAEAVFVSLGIHVNKSVRSLLINKQIIRFQRKTWAKHDVRMNGWTGIRMLEQQILRRISRGVVVDGAGTSQSTCCIAFEWYQNLRGGGRYGTTTKKVGKSTPKMLPGGVEQTS